MDWSKVKQINAEKELHFHELASPLMITSGTMELMQGPAIAPEPKDVSITLAINALKYHGLHFSKLDVLHHANEFPRIEIELAVVGEGFIESIKELWSAANSSKGY